MGTEQLITCLIIVRIYSWMSPNPNPICVWPPITIKITKPFKKSKYRFLLFDILISCTFFINQRNYIQLLAPFNAQKPYYCSSKKQHNKCLNKQMDNV